MSLSPLRGLLAENCRQMRPNLASGVALALLGTVLAKETCDPFESFALQPATKGGHARPTATPAHVCNTLTPALLCSAVLGSYSARLVGWAAGDDWDPVACPHHAEAGYQWLAFEGNMSAARRAGVFERASRHAIRVLRAGTISGSVRVHWTGTTTTWSKYLIVGASTLEPGALPSQHDTCSMPESACGACLDGFMMADCNCNVGAVDATFSHVVEAGQLVQVAAVPAQFEGAECLAGELFVAFTCCRRGSHPNPNPDPNPNPKPRLSLNLTLP